MVNPSQSPQTQTSQPNPTQPTKAADPPQELRQRLKQRFQPLFDQALQETIEVYASAEHGKILHQTEIGLEEVSNRLNQKLQQQGLQEHTASTEADFSPSGQADEAGQQGQ
jgi:tRNA A37 N6-isopentenylltransferase MiaA